MEGTWIFLPDPVLLLLITIHVFVFVAIVAAGAYCLIKDGNRQPKPQPTTPEKEEDKMQETLVPHVIELETIKLIPEDRKPGWIVELEGTATVVDEKGKAHSGEIARIDRLGALALHSGLGRLEYGLRPEGYDSWAWRNGGTPGKPGGAIAVPYAVADGMFYVGIFPEKRLAGNLETPPGGFIDVGEELEEGIYRELREETGITGRLIHIDHGGFADNRAFAVSIDGGNLSEVFALPVDFNLIEREPGVGLVLKSQPEGELEYSKQLGGIVKVRLVPILEYLAFGQDALGVSAAARVYAAYQLGLLP